MHGSCRLCSTTGDLLNSHILPRWAYLRLLRVAPTGSAPLPTVRSDGSRAIYDQQQTTEPLLCAKCEQRISSWEDGVARVAPQLDDTFPALQQLTPLSQVNKDGDAVADGSRLPSALGLFALSVFWRASISSVCSGVALGASLDEELRQYLLDSRRPRPRVSLDVQVLRPRSQLAAFHRGLAEPEGDGKGRNGFHFVVPGFYFALLPGPRPTRWLSVDGYREGFDPHCFLRHGTVVLGPSQELSAEIARHLDTVPKGGLARELTRRRSS